MSKWALPVVLIASSWVLAQDPAADDLKMFQGIWQAKTVEAGGQPAPKEGAPIIKVVVQKDQYEVSFNDKTVTKGTFKLDPTKKPKEIDAMPGGDPGKGMVQPGIYEFNKEGLRIVFAEAGQPRPKEFKSQAGSKQTMVQYEKVKK